MDALALGVALQADASQHDTSQRTAHALPALADGHSPLLTTANWCVCVALFQTLMLGVPLLGYAFLHAESSNAHLRLHAALRPYHSALFQYQHQQHLRALFSSLRGDVLELSPSDGSNFAYFPSNLVYSAIEPNPFLLSSFAANAAAAGYPAGTVALSHADVLTALRSMPDNSRDAVVASELLSRRKEGRAAAARDDWLAVVVEVHRVLKPGGRFYFVDHTAHNRSERLGRSVQSVLSPISRLLCHQSTLDTPIAQRMAANVEGWEVVHLQAWKPHAPAVQVEAIPSPAATQAEERTEESGGEQAEDAGGQRASDAEVEVTSLQGWTPVVAGICVKRKAATLSQYARQTQGSVMDDMFSYGTSFRSFNKQHTTPIPAPPTSPSRGR